MDVRAAAARSYLSIAKRYGSQGHLWIWKDGLGGFRGTDRIGRNGEQLCHLLTEEEIEAHEDWGADDVLGVDPQDKPSRHQHRVG